MASYDSIMAPLAAQAAAQLGDSTDEILGQWNEETGYGSEQNTGRIVNNPGNVETNGVVQSYPTMAQGVAAYIQTESQYATNDANDPEAFAQANEPYGGNAAYPSSVLGAIDSNITQKAANNATGTDQSLIDSIGNGKELTAAENGQPIYNPATMGDVTKNGHQVTSGNGKGKPDTVGSGFSIFDLNISKWFDDHWQYLVIILAIVLLLGAGIFGLSKSVTGSGFLPLPE